MRSVTAETLDTQHGRESGVADLFQDLPVAAALHAMKGRMDEEHARYARFMKNASR